RHQVPFTVMVIYLDHAATTPMRPEAIEAMMPYLDGVYANPSGSHRFARQARQAIDEARDTVAEVLGCKAGEVIFTSGGTEGDNSAVLGAVRKRGGKALCSAAEHHAVLHCVEHLHGHVVRTNVLGSIDIDALTETLTGASANDPISVVSVMAVNNEVGTVTPLREVAKIVRQHAPEALLHSDAVQAACWSDLREISKLVDVMTLSAHKFGGPKGVGIMMTRLGKELEPLILGGGQERDRRSGTHNVAGIVASATALRITDTNRQAEVERVGKLRDRLVDDVRAAVPDVLETVPREHRVAGIAHLCIKGCESEALLYLLDEAEVCASAASACASGAMEPSHVLQAMGVERGWSMGALRLSLGHNTHDDDIDRAIEVLVGAIHKLRR
ncbi:MAG: cysteine desulfurase family protein, partial [Ilumatobacteraceae bacterium]